jgi:hypothetical protein
MASNELGTNKAMHPGDSIKSPDGDTVLTLQQDGNLVLTGKGRQLWTSGTAGNSVDNVWMNYDGNLRITTPDNKVLWSNGASGHKDAFLRVNNGGTFYVWDGSNHQIWDSGTTNYTVNPTPGGHGAAHTDFGGFDKFLKEAANTCGDITKIVGPIIAIAANIIPGIGQAACAAIMAGVAAATATTAAAQAIINKDPKALDNVASAAASTIPGGDDPSVQAAIQLSASAVSTGQAVASNIQSVPPNIQSSLTSVGQLLAAGNPVDSPQVNSALSKLPPNVQSGVKLGSLTGNSAVVNSSSTITPAVLRSLQHLGSLYESSNPPASHARTLVPSGTYGFDIGLGCTINKISANNLSMIRQGLSPADQNGFDSALALHIGANVSPPADTSNAMQAAGHMITTGMQSAPEDNRVAMMKNVAKNPTARVGATIAVKQIANSREGFFAKIIHWFENLFTGL